MSIRTRIFVIIALFATLSFSIAWIGNPTSLAFRELAKLPNGVEIAVVGDSRAHGDISPTEVASTLASLGDPAPSAYNFSVNGTDVLHHYSLIANGLAKKTPPPRIVIWAPNPLEFNDSRLNNRLDQLLPQDVPALLSAGAPSEILFDVMAMWLFPPWRHRTQIAMITANHLARIGARSLPYQERWLGLHIAPDASESRRYLELPDGQEPFETLRWAERFHVGAESYDDSYRTFELSHWRFRIARMLAETVRKFGGKLIIAELPVAPYYQIHLATQPQHLEWREEMRKIAHEEGAEYWDDSRMYGDDRMFGDPAHMPRETAKLYSVSIGERIHKNARLRAALLKGQG